MKQGQKKAFLFSLLLHVFLLITLVICTYSNTQKRVYKKIHVRSVHYTPAYQQIESIACSQKTPALAPTPIKKTHVPSKKEPQKKRTHNTKKNKTSKCIAQALKNLDQSKKHTHSCLASLPELQHINPLISDTQQTQKLTHEQYYLANLIKLIQLHVQLPESGTASVRLIIQRNGDIKKIEVSNCSSPIIQQTIPTKLKTIHYPAFGSSFPGENEHVFCLCLSHNLVWTSS